MNRTCIPSGLLSIALALFAGSPARGQDQCDESFLPDPTLPNPPGWNVDYDPFWLPGPQVAFQSDFYSLSIDQPLTDSFGAAVLAHSTVSVVVGFTITSQLISMPPDDLLFHVILKKGATNKAVASFYAPPAVIPADVPTTVELTASAEDVDTISVLIDGYTSVMVSISDFHSSACIPTWTDIGSGLAGVSGVPSLTGSGTLASGSAGSLALASARPSSFAMLFMSLSSTPVPFKGGVLAAFPAILTLPLSVDGTGGLVLPWTWPAGVPSQTLLYFQCAIKDAAAVLGVSLSNAVQGLTP